MPVSKSPQTPFLPSSPFLTSCVSSAQAVPKTTSGLLCVCPLGAGCPKMPQHPHVCLISSGCLKSQNPCFCYPCTTTLSRHALCVYACQNVCVRVLKHTHLTIYSNILSLLCLCVCCSAVKTCLAGLCAAIEDKKRETEFLSALPCFTASLHCCCAALCSCVLPRLPSALCVLLICPSVHSKAAVRNCVSVLCAAVQLQTQILRCGLCFALCCCVCVLQ